MRCPVCGSTRIKKIEGTNTFRCDRCGYEHWEKVRGKILISKTGFMDENHWMR